MVKQFLFATLLFSNIFTVYSAELEYYFDLLPEDVKGMVRTFSGNTYRPIYNLNLYFLVLNNDHTFLQKYGEMTMASLNSDRWSSLGEDMALEFAKKHNRTECIDFFQKAGVNRHLAYRCHDTQLEPRVLLKSAVESGHYQAAYYFISQRVDINTPIANDGFTFLMSAALNNRISIAKLLLDAGAKLDARTECQNCKYGSYDADYPPSYRGPRERVPCGNHSEQETALSIAQKREHRDIAALIIDYKKKKDSAC